MSDTTLGYLDRDEERVSRYLKRSWCALPGPYGAACSNEEGVSHRYAHYDSGQDTSWTDGWEAEAPDPVLPEQPDGIDEDSRDYPDPRRAAERIAAFISEWGDGLVDQVGDVGLYARDLASLARFTLDTLGSPADEPKVSNQ